LARRDYKVEFEPLSPTAVTLLSWATDIDFSEVDFGDMNVWMCCTVRDGYGVPVIVIVFEFKSPWDAHATVVCIDPRPLTRRLLTAIFRGVFTHAARITALIEPSNHRALKQIYRFGFRREGTLRRGYDGERDAFVFGLLPEDCPYLWGKPFRIRSVQVTHEPAQRMQ
jgi:hypothetical protein